jgi:hypothetical protein
VLILQHDTVRTRNAHFSNVSATTLRLEQAVLGSRQALAAMEQAWNRRLAEQQSQAAQARQFAERLQRLRTETAAYSETALAKRARIERLSTDLRSLESEAQQLRELAQTVAQRGDKVHRFVGDGDRQYLSGLKLGGKRILILLDTSASMLSPSVLEIIRLRNLGENAQRKARKWRRAIAATEWLISNLPVDAQFQLYGFNNATRALVADSAGKWLRADALRDVAAAVAALKALLPHGGTRLYQAFAVAQTLTPRADNILLITDGLPTLGRAPAAAPKVSGEQRLAHFTAAMALLPSGVPVNTLLLPMEGDVYAAAAYWRLAIDSHGSFLTPAADWP